MSAFAHADWKFSASDPLTVTAVEKVSRGHASLMWTEGLLDQEELDGVQWAAVSQASGGTRTTLSPVERAGGKGDARLPVSRLLRAVPAVLPRFSCGRRDGRRAGRKVGIPEPRRLLQSVSLV